MFDDGDVIKIIGLPQSSVEKIADTMQSEFDSVIFYFIEYLDGDYATVSAETDSRFAIIKVHLDYIVAANQADLHEIDQLLNYMLIDFSLSHHNKEMFMELTQVKDTENADIQINAIYDELDDGSLLSEDSEYMELYGEDDLM